MSSLCDIFQWLSRKKIPNFNDLINYHFNETSNQLFSTVRMKQEGVNNHIKALTNPFCSATFLSTNPQQRQRHHLQWNCRACRRKWDDRLDMWYCRRWVNHLSGVINCQKDEFFQLVNFYCYSSIYSAMQGSHSRACRKKWDDRLGRLGMLYCRRWANHLSGVINRQKGEFF